MFEGAIYNEEWQWLSLICQTQQPLGDGALLETVVTHLWTLLKKHRSTMKTRPCQASRSADGILVVSSSHHIHHAWLVNATKRGRNSKIATPRATAASARASVTNRMEFQFVLPEFQLPVVQDALCHLIFPAAERQVVDVGLARLVVQVGSYSLSHDLT